jgi:hypothetical protein
MSIPKIKLGSPVQLTVTVPDDVAAAELPDSVYFMVDDSDGVRWWEGAGALVSGETRVWRALTDPTDTLGFFTWEARADDASGDVIGFLENGCSKFNVVNAAVSDPLP